MLLLPLSIYTCIQFGLHHPGGIGVASVHLLCTLVLLGYLGGSCSVIEHQPDIDCEMTQHNFND